MKSKVTYILNTWQRPHTLSDQVQAISNQTVKCDELMIWQNKPEKAEDSFIIRDDEGS